MSLNSAAKTIHFEVSAGNGQTNSFTETLEYHVPHHGTRKLRIRIHVDHYPQQSSAVIEGFDLISMKWNPIASIHYSNLRSKVTYKNACRADFQIDRDNLLGQAIALLS